jgi:RNA polymerase sigma factor, sigma-70 family
MINSKVVLVKGRDTVAESDINSRFNEIYDSTNKIILAFITARCGNLSDTGDIFQDTYMELYQLMDKRGADYVTDSKALVFKIAKQKLAKHYSLIKRLQMFVSLNRKNDDGENEEIEISDAEINSFLFEDFAIDRIMLDNTKKLIKQKSPEIEQIFYFFYDMGLSIPEIAEALSISESNVKNKIYRTLNELRELLNVEGGN